MNEDSALKNYINNRTTTYSQVRLHLQRIGPVVEIVLSSLITVHKQFIGGLDLNKIRFRGLSFFELSGVSFIVHCSRDRLPSLRYFISTISHTRSRGQETYIAEKVGTTWQTLD